MVGLFLRWWAVPNAQRESHKAWCRSDEGFPHRRTGLTAHSLWRPYTNYRMVQDIRIAKGTKLKIRRMLSKYALVPLL